MASVLKAKNRDDLTADDRRGGKRWQWNAHCGARQRARHLRRLQADALREQRDSCDWLTETQTLPAAAAAPADDPASP